MKRATYTYYEGGTETALIERSGQIVDVLAPLSDAETDVSMFRVRFADGHEAEAFEDELTEQQ